MLSFEQSHHIVTIMNTKDKDGPEEIYNNIMWKLAKLVFIAVITGVINIISAITHYQLNQTPRSGISVQLAGQ